MLKKFAMAAVVLSCLLAACATAADADRPNIIYIMADDLGYGDLGCYGQKTIQTPHLDQLVKEGMRFTDYYAGNTVCRPSRLVLWTGLHSGHTAISSNAGYVFKPDDVTVMELLKEAGYATGGVGKWAMGGPQGLGRPTAHGFDFWMGYLNQSEAHNYYPTHLWRCAGESVEKVPLPGNVLMGDKGAAARVAKPGHRETYSHDVMTEEAFGFIRRSKDKPFLLHIHWTIPHANNEGGRLTGDGMEVPDYGIYKNKDWPSTAKGQAAMITRMDADVGRLVDLLRELKIDKRTLILFTSDNGPHSEGGHKHQYFDANGPLRGHKRDLYEGGIRVPLIAWWPDRVKAGTTSELPCAFQDFLPTACALAGAKSPGNIDGISLLPTLLGQNDKQRQHEFLYFQYGSARQPDKIAVRAGHWKLVRPGKSAAPELYDLSEDIGETTNIADEHEDVVARLKQLAARAAEE